MYFIHPFKPFNSFNVPSFQGHPWQMQLVMNAPFLSCPAPCDTGAKSAKKSLPYLLRYEGEEETGEETGEERGEEEKGTREKSEEYRDDGER